MNETHQIGKQFYRIAIVYLAIGKYDVFWDEFYRSCERYLFPDATKHYFVFTDSGRLLNRANHGYVFVIKHHVLIVFINGFVRLHPIMK